MTILEVVRIEAPTRRNCARRFSHVRHIAAQEFVRLSQCPDFVDGRLEARSIVLRVFAVRVGEHYELMPGGLTRVAEEESSYGALMLQAGGQQGHLG